MHLTFETKAASASGIIGSKVPLNAKPAGAGLVSKNGYP